MLERTKIIDCNIGNEQFQATIKVLSAIEADACSQEKINDIELIRRFCEKVEGVDKVYTADEFLALPGSYRGAKQIDDAIVRWGWLGGDAKNE